MQSMHLPVITGELRPVIGIASTTDRVPVAGNQVSQRLQYEGVLEYLLARQLRRRIHPLAVEQEIEIKGAGREAGGASGFF